MRKALGFDLRMIGIGALVLFAACAPETAQRTGGTPGDNKMDSPTSPAPTPASNPNADADGDGVTGAAGDCNDADPMVGPKAFEVAGNGIDDDCDGQIDEVADCDTAIVGTKTADAITKSMGLCDPRFVGASAFNGPSDPRARDVVASYGAINVLEGKAMAVLSTGIAQAGGGYSPQPGTELQKNGPANDFANPYTSLTTPLGTGCGGSTPPSRVNDYTEYAITLTTPQNATGFSFQFQFLSAEYPEFVCSQYNDRFLVIMSDASGAGSENIAFDSAMNAISVNNGFFTVCENWDQSAATRHCTQPVSQIAGTGYDRYDGYDVDGPIGGSTGWLTTTAPLMPNAQVKLRFIIFDEGDHKLDSAVLLDNFQWKAGTIPAAPVTVQ